MNNSQIIDQVITNVGRMLEKNNARLRWEILRSVEDAISQLESGGFLPSFIVRNIKDTPIEPTEQTTTIGNFKVNLPRSFIKGMESTKLCLIDPDTNVKCFPQKVFPEDLTNLLKNNKVLAQPLFYTVATRTPEPTRSSSILDFVCGATSSATALAFKNTITVSNTSGFGFAFTQLLVSPVTNKPIKIQALDQASVVVAETPWLGNPAFQTQLDAAVAGSEVSTGPIQDFTSEGVLQDLFSIYSFDPGLTTIEIFEQFSVSISAYTYILYNPLGEPLNFEHICVVG